VIVTVNGHKRKLADLGSSLADLRETLTHYHASVLGHGILLSELEERVRASNGISASNRRPRRDSDYCAAAIPGPR
jgi:hypothetical protein